MLRTVNLYVRLRCATRGHEGVRPGVVSGGIIDHQVVLCSITFDPVPGAHSSWNLNAIFHPSGKIKRI